MKRLAMVFALLVTALFPAFAQRPPDVEAFLDAFFARNVDELARHLPSDIEKRIAELTPDDKLRLGHDLLLARTLEREGGKITRSDDPAVLISFQEKSGSEAELGEIVLDRRICDGNESMLILRLRAKSDSNPEKERFMLWLHYEEGNWRVTELQDAGSQHTIKLDEATLLSSYVESTPAGNESIVESILRVYNTALVTYAANYPDSGLPNTLEMLGTDNTDAPNPYRAALVNNAYTTAPYEASGYRFNYVLVNDDPGRRYTITARPLRFSYSGSRSFYTDDSAVIRFTAEDRDATKDDDPI